jgi:ABC-type thiamine transport system substrate-binding protein
MGRDKALLAKLLQVAAENPHTGSAEQVVTLALCVAQSNERLSVPAYQVFRSEVGVGEKVFSKLKTICPPTMKLAGPRQARWPVG